jgi:hypothetical protein
MIDRLISFSLKQRLVILVMVRRVHPLDEVAEPRGCPVIAVGERNR